MPEGLNFPGLHGDDNRRTEPPDAEVKAYDFRRPICFSGENLKFLQAIHAVFSREAELRLRYLPGVELKLEVTELDQQTFTDFMEQTPEPAVIFVLKMNPTGLMFFDLEAAGALNLVDIALGGKGETARQELLLTGIEQDILTAIVKRTVLPALGTAWKTCLKTAAEILYFEVNPRNLQPLLEEMCLIVRMQLNIEGKPTGFRLCYPYSMLEPLIPILSGEFNRTHVPISTSWQNSTQNPTFLKQYVEFPLENMRITITDILKWKNPAALGLPAGLVGTTSVTTLPPEGVYYE